MSSYVASRISSDSNTLYPDMLEIMPDKVVYYKGHVIGYTTKVIHTINIASVSISSGLFFADVTIASKGGEWITAQGFTKSKAKQIVNELNQYIR